MRLNKILGGTPVAILLTIGFASESQYFKSGICRALSSQDATETLS